jgi:hypothetical protein
MASIGSHLPRTKTRLGQCLCSVSNADRIHAEALLHRLFGRSSEAPKEMIARAGFFLTQ